MGSPSDRLRRILSDGPPSPPGRDEPPPAPRVAPRLRARLEALGVRPARELVPPPAGAAPGAPPRPLEALVAGASRTTPFGDLLVAERRHPLDRTHGRVVLADAHAHPVGLRVRERGPDGRARLDPERAVFLDTETTGLAGGTGTVAFLVGLGRIEGDAFVVRQYCMRDYPEEPALLHAIVEAIGDAPLVTFNGRAFDWPLLETRLRLHRLRVPPRAHLDLLPPARRIWRSTVPGHALTVLERHVLGLEREDDLPGSLVPQAWFRYLRTGEADALARAFVHNEDDVVSMLALLARVAAALAHPGTPAASTPTDHLGTARLLLDLGDRARARRCLEAGIDGARGAAELPLRRLLAQVLKREGDHRGALAHWSRLAREAPAFDARAYEEAAIACERRIGDLPQALRWTREALERAPPSGPAREALARRALRLARRLERAGGRVRSGA